MVGTFSAHIMMGGASEFLEDQRGQFREGSIFPVTPARQEIGHSLLRDRRRIHNLLFSYATTRKTSAHASVSAKNLNSNDHFGRSFFLIAMEAKLQTKKKTKNHNFTVNKSGYSPGKRKERN